MGTHLNYSGLVIAGIGFGLTRFTVTLAIYEEPLPFYLAGVVPLALGLGLAAFGVALTVADAEASLVRTTARWCVVGAGTMLFLVVLTLLGSTGGMPDFTTVRSQTYLSNFLIGGSIGGTLTGLYAARTRRQRSALEQQANRLEILNRILRHEVLNAVTVIRGYATLDAEKHPMASTEIVDQSNSINQTIEEVKYLVQSAGTYEVSSVPIDLGDCLTASAASVREAYPEAKITIDPVSDDLQVRANDHLDRVFTHVLENAAIHAADEEATVDVSVQPTSTTVRVSVRDEGPGLPDPQRSLLETGDIAEYDDPGTGFGLNVVRLLVEGYGGTIETDVGETGTTITVELPRAAPEPTGLGWSHSTLVDVRPAIPHLLVTLGAAVVAGWVYGFVAEQLGGSIGFIGVYYGIQNPVVGWIAHEFHSIVFAFVFASLVSVLPSRYRDWLPAYVALGIAWGIVLWIVAAGIVSPVWLGLIGVSVPIPNLSVMLFVPHVVWGGSLGVLTAIGYKYVVPSLTHDRSILPSR